ncbi:metallophosphoesterase [Stanieria cyanosphaera PCC 7437]|uniref:Metallophosphoesterase n=1 Tax=Stanieria cyanosphaera (strain ATCC 29371 / PCC 7437) TaxID=111780 RepID=K9XT66_STAC7|nr:metallophosphoesterase [Stanieria cyanosphaera]AFZ35254.1 metallophosphoesterase [Stanieria cyanosphaera PCC 7437]
MTLIINEPLKIERIAIAIANLPQSLQGKKIVQFSDLHYDGIRLSEHLLAEAIDLSNQENPDLVVLTGDFVTDDPSPIENLALRLKRLTAKTGLYACLGNHDYCRRYPNSQQQITDALTAVEIQVLWNEIAYPWGQDLALVGLADFWSREFQPELVFNQIAPEIPRIVLSHNPDSAEILKPWRVDLQLSGHTHGGQFVIPGYGAAPILLQQIRKATPKSISKHIPFLRECYRVVKYWQWSEGWHQVGNNQLYVNRGLGTYAPGRLFCPPEMTVITLESRE